MHYLFNVYARLILWLQTPLVLSGFFARSTGHEYGVGLRAKLRLLWKMWRNTKRLVTASHLLEHLAMAQAILQIPRGVEGCLVECGCYKGGSTANLSLVAALVGRKLHVFDSFAGLPEPTESDRAHMLAGQAVLHTYAKGAWCGRLEEVVANVRRCGNLAVCEFHRGYFDDTLPGFKQPVAFVFLDVDLVESLKPCLIHLWPLLAERCRLFTHEAPHHEVALLFYDRSWWSNHVGCDAPGLVGAGNGLGLVYCNGTYGSDLGYAIKNSHKLGLPEIPQPGLEDGANNLSREKVEIVT